jgi:hypothetical protein
LAHDSPYDINIVDATVYYASHLDHNVYRVGVDGTERQALSNAEAGVDATDAFIYYQKDKGDSVRLWRMNSDGSGDMEVITDGRATVIGITEHMLLFEKSFLEWYVSDPDGGNIRPWP